MRRALVVAVDVVVVVVVTVAANAARTSEVIWFTP